jgi:hypothetical protein
MIMGKDKLIPVFAMILLIIGIFSAIYVHATMVNKKTITIQGEEYTIDQLFSIGETKTIQTVEGEKTGVALDDLILKIGMGCPSCYNYVFKGGDGYQQTISWDLMEKGVLSKNRKIYFPESTKTAKGLWVKDIVEIEVK